MNHLRQVSSIIAGHFRKRRSCFPSAPHIKKLIETLFFASLKTEESRGVFCTIVFVDSSLNDMESHQLSRRLHRHIYIPLLSSIPLTPRSLSKFAQAAPPWAACVAVRENKGQFEICGMYDQEIHYLNALNREGENRFSRPGVFQIEVSGAGTLTVYDNHKLIAKLSQDTLVTKFHDVLNDGPISTELFKYIDNLEKRSKKQLQKQFHNKDISGLIVDAAKLWIQMLSRILLGIRRLKHGGAVLLIPSDPTNDLFINYSISYEKIENILEKHLVASARWEAARSKMRAEEYLEVGAKIPAELVKERRDAFNLEQDAKKGEQGCATFVSSLCGVDGLILLSNGLRVAGFGVEIKRGKDPEKVFSAGSAKGMPSCLKRLDLSHFGTRHRSMMRYCDRHPGSIGFVISQDGDVRAMTKTTNGLIVWENIQLQEFEVDNQSAKKKSAVPKIQKRCGQIEEQLCRSILLTQAVDNGDEAAAFENTVWITLSGDPLKVTTKRGSPKKTIRTDVYFGADLEVIMSVKRVERIYEENVFIEEQTDYFNKWTLVQRTRKMAQSPIGVFSNLAGVKALKVDISDLDESETRPHEITTASEEVIRSVILQSKSGARYVNEYTDGEHRFSFIQGTASLDGRYALAFNLEQETENLEPRDGTLDFMRQQYVQKDYDFELAPPNYVINLEDSKVIGYAGCRYIGTRTNFNHQKCQVVWSLNNRYMLQLHQGKWQTLKAAIVLLSDIVKKPISLDITQQVSQDAFDFLKKARNRALRKYGWDKFAMSFSCEEISISGYLTIEVFGEIPKFGEDDAVLSTIQRYRIGEKEGQVTLKLIHCETGRIKSYDDFV